MMRYRCIGYGGTGERRYILRKLLLPAVMLLSLAVGYGHDVRV